MMVSFPALVTDTSHSSKKAELSTTGALPLRSILALRVTI
jgi:hypothetical protein